MSIIVLVEKLFFVMFVTYCQTKSLGLEGEVLVLVLNDKVLILILVLVLKKRLGDSSGIC